MDSSEWQEQIEKLAFTFDSPSADNQRTNTDPWSRIKTGVLSPLQEDGQRYYATAVIQKDKKPSEASHGRVAQGRIRFMESPHRNPTPE